MFEIIDPRIASDNVVPLNDCGGSFSHAISMQIWRCDPTGFVLPPVLCFNVLLNHVLNTERVNGDQCLYILQSYKHYFVLCVRQSCVCVLAKGSSCLRLKEVDMLSYHISSS